LDILANAPRIDVLTIGAILEPNLFSIAIVVASTVAVLKERL
jgi:hypothetical protein